MATAKELRRNRIHMSIRKKVAGNSAKPRLSVFRSNAHIYAQLIDDEQGRTLASASSYNLKDAAGNKTEQSKQVGQLIAEAAKAAGITACTFDRGGYLYHGRVKALADGAREGGLQF